jgi:hypothetical protein
LAIIADGLPTFVEQAQLMNDELIRCAILWHELWHEALEDASRFYFQVLLNVQCQLTREILRNIFLSEVGTPATPAPAICYPLFFISVRGDNSSIAP